MKVKPVPKRSIDSNTKPNRAAGIKLKWIMKQQLRNNIKDENKID